jgi:RNA polymerase sigma-70 factor (ECF subfamily)
VTGPSVPPNKGGEPSTSLLVNARNGDPRAWERLVSLSMPLVLRWCRRGGVPDGDVPDVAQEVLRAVARALAAFRRDRPGDSFRAWLRTITRNKARDYHRRRRREGPAGEGGSDAQERLHQLPQEESSAPAEADEAEERRLLLRRAVELIQAEVDETTWLAFWGVEIEGRPAAEVAVGLGRSVNAVYLAKGRVRKRLREEFADLLDE